MTQLDMSKVSYCSLFPGLGNPDTVPLSYNVASQSIGIGTPYEATTLIAFSATTRLVTVLTQVGLDSIWRVNSGALTQNYTAANLPVYSGSATGVYQVVVAFHFSGNNIVIYTRVGALSGSRTVPAFTVNLTISKFVPPF